MSEWTFITRHGLVIAYVAQHPRSTTREIASAIHVTERTVHKCIAELEAEGYVKRRKVGRSNIYRINPRVMLRHDTVRHISVADLLKLLGGGGNVPAGRKRSQHYR